ncbi:MAG TPA: FixH family protein [Clostridium sp.]
MKFKSLKNLVFTLVLILPFSTLAFASTTGTQINKDGDGVKSSLTFANEKVNPGSNQFTLSILDKNGKPLPNANLKITADMDHSTGMGGMNNMSNMNDMSTKNKPTMIALKESSKKGEYTGMVDFKSTGKWIVKSTFDVQGQAKNIDFNVNVQKSVPKVDDVIKSSLTFSNKILHPGSNDFTISILDKNGNPLSNPNLKVTADMDNSTGMSGMSGMTAENKPTMIALKQGSKKGEYTGTVDFKSTGKWIVKSTFDVQGQAKNIDFNVNVQKAGPNFLIIGGFGGVIVLIIVVAAINKKKSIKS